MAKLVVDEITLMGSRCGDMSLALHFLKSKLLDPGPMIQAEFPLAKAQEAFAAAGARGALKVLIKTS